MSVTITMEINNCTKCPHHKVFVDPDPFDFFCDDDCAVRCMIAKGEPKTGTEGQFYSGIPMITAGCRPHNLEKECSIPSWCPVIAPENKI